MSRLEYFNKFIEDKFPNSVNTFFNMFSDLYPNRYKSLGKIDNGKDMVNLFDYLENWFENEYEIPFKINNHFEFHTDLVFFTPTKKFGFETQIKNYEELFLLEPEYRKISNTISPFSIYSYCFSNRPISSKIISKKLDDDMELEFEYFQLNLKSYFKRFFIQGGVDSIWITLDQLNHYGIDKFPNSLNSELKRIEYSSEFDLKYGHLGTMYDEFGIVVQNQDEITKENHDYCKNLRVKGYKNLNYIDILSQPSYKKSFMKTDGDYIFANCEQLGRIPILKLNHHFVKRQKNIVYQNKLLNLRERATSFYNKFDYKTPYELPKSFKLDPSDIIKDDKLLSEYLDSYNEPENEIRKIFGLPKIGEGWISETFLYYQIKNHFSKDLVIHHGRPLWLGRQHLDIYFPLYNIGIEFQGDQHYYPIDFFGGEKSFKESKERDIKKRKLCLANNCILIEVISNYKIDNIIDQITEIIKKSKNI